MQLTQEQKRIIDSKGDIKISAVAGSGKTSTIVEYARARPSSKKILYLVFNKSAKLEALRKFTAQGLSNVKVETAHSLAYRHIVAESNYVVRAQSYKINELIPLLGIRADSQLTAYSIAGHVNKFVSYFCNSAARKVSDLNYLDLQSEPKSAEFVKNFYKQIELGTRVLLTKMERAEIEITHDFYLKKFQLSDPQLNYDYILFDEGQDASPAMLAVFIKQNATKVIVGDTHQQIYSWRYAVNSLEQVNYPSYTLSNSFRFGQEIASLAVGTLQWKDHLGADALPLVNGLGAHKVHKTKAILARTNLGLLLKAIEYLTVNKKTKYIYFEGNINSYIYGDEGTSLYDILNLAQGKHKFIRNDLLKSMKDTKELEEYCKQTEDSQLKMMLDIVDEYGSEISSLMQRIKKLHVEPDEKHKAEIIFSTVHRAKGMEYDSVELVNDFITEEKIKKQCQKEDKNLTKLNEEINLLYVAITRARCMLTLPREMLPKDFPLSERVKIVQSVIRNSQVAPASKSKAIAMPTSYTGSSIFSSGAKASQKSAARSLPATAGEKWTGALDRDLTDMFHDGATIKVMAQTFGRTTGAINARLKKLGLK